MRMKSMQYALLAQALHSTEASAKQLQTFPVVVASIFAFKTPKPGPEYLKVACPTQVKTTSENA